jgi:pimeloyl-ACP methyl ester carboxylesterase
MSESTPRAPRPPAGFIRQQYDINNVRTVVYAGGKGKPVVYLHGGGSWHGFDFAQRWVSEHEVFAPSLPGWGASADAPPELDSMPQYQLHLLDLFDQMGLKHFDLVGISMGGWMATEFAVSHPERVRKLVLCCPAGLPSPEYPGPPNLGKTLASTRTCRRHPRSRLCTRRRSRANGARVRRYSPPAARSTRGSSAGSIASRCRRCSSGRRPTSCLLINAVRNG